MQKKKIAAALGLMLASAGTAQAGSFINYDTRSMGMGGLSVVTSTIDGAPFNNPAMLAAAHRDDDFSVLLSAGSNFGDPYGIIADIETFTTHMTNVQNELAGGPPDPAVILAETTAAQAALANTGGKNFIATPGGGASVSMSGEKWSLAVSAIASADLQLGISGADGVSAPTFDPVLGTTDAQLNTVALITSDVGVSLARNFDLGTFELAVGVTPKLSSIQGGVSSQSLDSATYTTLPTGDVSTTSPNLDAGVVLRLTENLKVGVVGKNMMAQEITTSNGTVLNLEPQLRAGAAYNSKTFTIGVDMDLTENAPIAAGGFSTQRMVVGTEINAFDIAQLRAGVATDLLDSNYKQLSVGAGVRVPFIGLNINLAVTGNPDNPSQGIGGYLSFGMKI